MGEAEPGLSVVARLFRTLEKGVAPADRMVAASELERVVAEAVRGAGFDVVQGIGGSGMRVDLAVLEPGGRCVLGILCDGIEYGSAPAARDRDRLRPHLLMTRGWRIHRVWSVEWFRNPERELQRILAVIEETRADRATLIKAPRPLPSNGAKTAFKEPD
jgi:very-short-patch-repair endonuclease